MLLTPKWQTMWMESQHCSKSLANVPLPSEQGKKILEDLKVSCCSPNKAVQIEALKCWGIWIKNQNPEDWKLNTVCYTAVRPLLIKKLQPLHKDVDVCKLKLSLMWAMLVKVQNIMQLEGPQYILEVFLQSCLTWLSSTSGDKVDNEISILIFQLLLGIFKKDENLIVCDKEIFPLLSTEIFQLKKVFHCLADKFLNLLVYWRKVQDKSLILKIWKCFLEQCENSCEHIPIPVWHKIFKLAGQVCSEQNEPVKERLAFLHSSATKLKSVLLSSKFIDYGNLLTTPCEAFLKKLVELCVIECEEFCDPEMFSYSQETCRVLSEESVAFGGYDLCIFVLDALEEFSLRSLYWGVWCGLVRCYEVRLMGIDKKKYTKTEIKFYRKLRGVAVNFDLDKEYLHKDCNLEVQKCINLLNINCLCSASLECGGNERVPAPEKVDVENDSLPRDVASEDFFKQIVPAPPRNCFGKFSTVSLYKKTCGAKLPTKTISIKFDLIKDIFKSLDSDTVKSLLNGLFSFRFISPNVVQKNESVPENVSLQLNLSVDSVKKINLTLSCVKEKTMSSVDVPVKKVAVESSKATVEEEEVISTPKTRSRRRAEEEQMRKEMESQKRRKRKSFEVLVQEIVKKNKIRKTEKNCTKRKSPVLTSKTDNQRGRKAVEKAEKSKREIESPRLRLRERKVKNSKKEEPKDEKKKQNKSGKNQKLENYFKVITKKSGNEAKKEESSKVSKGKKSKKMRKETRCCNAEEETERKGEISWRQTSLETMMNQKKKEKAKHKMRTRNKTAAEEKTKSGRRIPSGKSVVSTTPFKEVFHDHEYAKTTLPDLRTPKRVPSDKEKSKESKVSARNEVEEEADIFAQVEEELVVEEGLEVVPELPEVEWPSDNGTHLTEPSPKETQKTETEDVPASESPEMKGKKRSRILDGLKPSKKIKFCSEEAAVEEKSLSPEKVEKENVESLPEENLVEFASPIKEEVAGEKTGGFVAKGKGDASPKAANGRASSISRRALRIIALVPESTKTGQMHWDPHPKTEVSKCMKAPNVDKNSRASKMLALLSENAVREMAPAEELIQTKAEEVLSVEDLATTPKAKTPASTLKSPKSVKKRKSIRFDDDKNQTVLYETDTPPSHILMEKEKWRLNRSPEVMFL